MSRILITGGAGFIGSHTAKYLTSTGHEVFVYDFFHQYILPIRPNFLENMNYRFNHLLEDTTIVRGGTNNKDQLRRQIIDINPNCIIHLAALPLANVALNQTEEAFSGIVQGTVNLLEILRDVNSVKRLVYVSSSMIYGDFTQTPMPENGLKEPKEIYGSMKLAGEILVKGFSARHDIPYVIVRPSAVYGPTDNNRRVLQIFIENAIKGIPIKATNPKTTHLDFTFVEDVAEGLSKIANSSGIDNKEFNLTRGEGKSLDDAINLIKNIIPNIEVKTEIEKETFRPNRGALDITQLKEFVGFVPKHSLALGIKKYIEFIKVNNPSISNYTG